MDRRMTKPEITRAQRIVLWNLKTGWKLRAFREGFDAPYWVGVPRRRVKPPHPVTLRALAARDMIALRPGRGFVGSIRITATGSATLNREADRLRGRR